VVHASLGYEQSKLISSHSSLASIQHVGVRPIVPPGEVSWKQPCCLTGAPLHDDDDDDDRWFSTPRVLWTVRHSTGKVTENQQEDCSSQSEIMIRFVASSFKGDRRLQKSSSASATDRHLLCISTPTCVNITMIDIATPRWRSELSEEWRLRSCESSPRAFSRLQNLHLATLKCIEPVDRL